MSATMKIVPWAEPISNSAPHTYDLLSVGTRANPLHFSALKRIGESALDFAYFSAYPPKRTGPQAIGALVHEEILGARPGAEILRFPGDSRRGKAWDQFLRENPGREIATQSDVDDAAPIVNALRASKLCEPWLTGRTEVPLACEIAPDIWCETRGLDVVGEGFVTELKTTHKPNPEKFVWEIRQYCYAAQLALYRLMAHQCGAGKLTDRAIIVVAGTSEPWHCYPIELPESWLSLGHATLCAWIERFRSCRDANEWPGYTQALYQLPAPFEAGSEDDE